MAMLIILAVIINMAAIIDLGVGKRNEEPREI
jgi:hypothetical protein